MGNDDVQRKFGVGSRNDKELEERRLIDLREEETEVGPGSNGEL